MKTLKIPKADAQKVKEELKIEGSLDTDKLTDSDSEYVYFPLKKEIETDYEIVDREVEERQTDTSFEEELQEILSEKELKKIKTSQDIIGNIAIIELDESIEDKQTQIGEALLTAKPYLESVYKKGKHEGTYRTQELEWLAGKKNKETIHMENSVRMKLNPETVYFSPRLATERKRISELVKTGENVLVMFSGCGPFALIIAKNTEAEKVVAVEINPEGHKYALENKSLNKLDNLKFHNGDVAEIVPELKEEFDRVIMPAPDNASDYLELALSKVKKNGFIHYYDFADEENIPEELENNMRKACEKTGRKFKVLNVERCGSVSPGRYRVCLDCQVI